MDIEEWYGPPEKPLPGYRVSRLPAARRDDLSAQEKAQGPELTAEEKAENKSSPAFGFWLSTSCRVSNGVELSKNLCNTKAFVADQVMEIACGLHNFRTRLRDPIVE